MRRPAWITALAALWLCASPVLAAAPTRPSEAVRAVLAAQDPPGEVERMRPLAAAGDAWAQYYLGLFYSRGEGIAADQTIAAQWYQKAADQGLAEAKTDLGLLYLQGHGVAIDRAKGVALLEASAEVTASQHNLCAAYGLGLGGLPVDLSKAANWCKRAATSGDALGKSLLGQLYGRGAGGLRKDLREQLRLVTEAANQNLDLAQAQLGYLYEQGQGVAKNPVLALYWWRLAAAQGNATAEFDLGLAYRDGAGVKADPQRAISWFRLAATQGQAGAAANLAMDYQRGEGVAPDLEQALFWWRKAAAGGVSQSQKQLGLAYAYGAGAERDELRALAWLDLAIKTLPTAVGEQIKATRPELAASLGPAGAARAQALADAWTRGCEDIVQCR
ncbi:MAG: hypothetical protein JWM33_2938 [Caulobacteraceae bacterium]|nr:hypothetical protein [Caulobacteraceae bacterium]